MEEVIAKVALIPDPYTIVINKGSEAGLRAGDQIEIFDKQCEISDPDTDEVIGVYAFAIETAEIVRVYSKFSVCQRLKVTKTNLLISPLHQFTDTKESRETLHVRPDQVIDQFFIPGTIKVGIGNSVRVVNR